MFLSILSTTIPQAHTETSSFLAPSTTPTRPNQRQHRERDGAHSTMVRRLTLKSHNTSNNLKTKKKWLRACIYRKAYLFFPLFVLAPWEGRIPNPKKTFYFVQDQFQTRKIKMSRPKENKPPLPPSSRISASAFEGNYHVVLYSCVRIGVRTRRRCGFIQGRQYTYLFLPFLRDLTFPALGSRKRHFDVGGVAGESLLRQIGRTNRHASAMNAFG